MKGERPKQPHYAVIWDASQAVGRTEVTDLIEDVLTGLRTEERMFPDLHAHKVTEALIKAGYLDAVVMPHIDDIVAAGEARQVSHVVTYEMSNSATCRCGKTFHGALAADLDRAVNKHVVFPELG